MRGLFISFDDYGFAFGQGVELAEPTEGDRSQVVLFQEQFARYHDCEYGIAAANGTATLEMALRSRAGQTTYPGAFIAHWLEALLYYDAPAWVFALCYTIFGVLVAGSWFWVRPQPFRAKL